MTVRKHLLVTGPVREKKLSLTCLRVFFLVLEMVKLWLWALLTALCAADTGYFIHLSDVHLDLQYTSNTDPMFRCINTSVPSNDTAGVWGNYICDLPLRSYRATLDAINALNPKPDFILYTGDSVPHWLQYWSVQQYTEEMVVSGVSVVFSLLQAAFPTIPIFPALGNHDMFLSDQLPPPPKSDHWLAFIAQLWGSAIPKDAVETVAYGGYYSAKISEKLRLISFNSIHCDTSNLYAALNVTDHANQFVWFENTLKQARAAKEFVYVVSHITPTDYLGNIFARIFQNEFLLIFFQEFCLDKYLALARDYSDIIQGHFFGDRHSDEFR